MNDYLVTVWIRGCPYPLRIEMQADTPKQAEYMAKVIFNKNRKIKWTDFRQVICESI